jgi:UDPglucose 6-dehydrogenase
MGMDARIGGQFLNAGLGWGGSCFPKDVKALAHMAAVHGAHPQLLRSVMDINHDQRLRTVQKVRAALGDLDGRRVLVLGAAFKANTDDLRNSPAVELANLLHLEGAEVTMVDPVVTAGRLLALAPHVEVAQDAAAAAFGADAIVLATDWPEFRALPWPQMAAGMDAPLLIDARNFLDPASMRAAGFNYRCIGRPNAEGETTTAYELVGA